MARINTDQLVRHATNLGPRLYAVQQDPAVQKAWAMAGRDVLTAAKSLTEAAVETRSAWRRFAPGDGLAGAVA